MHIDVGYSIGMTVRYDYRVRARNARVRVTPGQHQNSLIIQTTISQQPWQLLRSA